MFVREEGDGHIKERLYIYWDVTTKCNYRCSYCYARHKYGAAGWNKTIEYRKQELVLAAIKLSTLPVYLGLHGGEPTMHHRYGELIGQVLKSLHRDLDTLYIATNCSPKILTTPRSDKIRILASFHPEFARPDEFVSTVLKLAPCYKTKVNILLHTDEQYWPALHDVYNLCIRHGITVHPHFIYDQVGDDEVLWDYTDRFYEEFKYMETAPCWYEFTDSTGQVHRVSDIELFNKKLNRFKTWTCYNNNYEILNNCLLHKICSNDYIDLTQNPLALRSIKHINPMTCPFETCSSDGVLKCLKTREI